MNQPQDDGEEKRAADRLRREGLYRFARFKERELIEEIVWAGRCIAAARHRNGDPIAPTDAVSSLLVALERSSYCCSISDVARLLHVSRQSAHETVRKAERARLVDLLTNPDDRRILQLVLTPAGRSALKWMWMAESTWLAELLIGLDQHRRATALQVVRVIRQRLLRNERERPRG